MTRTACPRREHKHNSSYRSRHSLSPTHSILYNQTPSQATLVVDHLAWMLLLLRLWRPKEIKKGSNEARRLVDTNVVCLYAERQYVQFASKRIEYGAGLRVQIDELIGTGIAPYTQPTNRLTTAHLLSPRLMKYLPRRGYN